MYYFEHKDEEEQQQRFKRDYFKCIIELDNWYMEELDLQPKKIRKKIIATNAIYKMTLARRKN